MDHPVLGKLKLNKRDGRWTGHVDLPAFAKFGRAHLVTFLFPKPISPDELEDMLDTAQQGLELPNLLLKNIAAQHGEETAAKMAKDMEAMLREVEAEDEDLPDEEVTPDPVEEARTATKNQETLADFDAGRFPLVIEWIKGGPSPEQVAAFEHVRKHQAKIFPKIKTALREMFSDYPDAEELESQSALNAALNKSTHFTGLRLATAQHNSKALVAFDFDADWEEEHGLAVAYHPDLIVTAGYWDDVFTDILDDKDDDWSDDPKWQEQAALHFAIESLQFDRIRNLLHVGLDPNQPHPSRKCSPLETLKRTLEKHQTDDAEIIEKLLRDAGAR